MFIHVVPLEPRIIPLDHRDAAADDDIDCNEDAASALVEHACLCVGGDRLDVHRHVERERKLRGRRAGGMILSMVSALLYAK